MNTANEIIALVKSHNWGPARRAIRELPVARVKYEDADKHNGGTAGILVDGVRVGQAANLLPGMDYAHEIAIRNNK